MDPGIEYNLIECYNPNWLPGLHFHHLTLAKALLTYRLTKWGGKALKQPGSDKKLPLVELHSLWKLRKILTNIPLKKITKLIMLAIVEVGGVGLCHESSAFYMRQLLTQSSNKSRRATSAFSKTCCPGPLALPFQLIQGQSWEKPWGSCD